LEANEQSDGEEVPEHHKQEVLRAKTLVSHPLTKSKMVSGLTGALSETL